MNVFSTKSYYLRFVLILLTFMLGAAVLFAQGDGNEGNGNNDKVTICHVAGDPDDSANYQTLVVDENALHGHFNTDGSPNENHENDRMGPCPEPEGDAPETDEATPEATDAADTSTETGDTPDVEATNARAVPAETSEITCTDWLVYHTYVTGDLEIFRLGEIPAGGDSNLTKGVGAADFGPSLGPDRQWMIFTSNRDGNLELYLARTDGTLLDRMTETDFNETDAVWSPTRGEAVYQINHDGQTDLMFIDLNTEQSIELVADGFNNKNAYWAPDGNSFLFVSDRDGEPHIYSYDRASGDITQISKDEGTYAQPQYDFSGQWIAYRAEVENGNSVLRLMNADGGDVRTISDEASQIGSIAWAPDGTAIAYQSDRDGNLDIFVYFLATESNRQLTKNDVDDYGPTWYCNTLTLAFTSDITGDANLFSALATPRDGAPLDLTADALQLTINEEDDFYPVQFPPEENGSNLLLDGRFSVDLTPDEMATEMPLEDSGTPEVEATEDTSN